MVLVQLLVQYDGIGSIWLIVSTYICKFNFKIIILNLRIIPQKFDRIKAKKIMTIKLNSFELHDNVINKMKDLLIESNKRNIELGFGFCKPQNRNIIVDRGSCVGTACEVEIKELCKIRESIAGTYHTHPGAKAFLTAADNMTACYEDISCVGGTLDNEIKCFTRKKDLIPSKDGMTRCFNEFNEIRDSKEIPIKEEHNKILEEKESIEDIKNLHRLGQKIDIDKLNNRISQFNDRVKKYDDNYNKYFEDIKNITDRNFNTTNIP